MENNKYNVPDSQGIEHTQETCNVDNVQPVISRSINHFAGKANLSAVDLIKNATQASTEGEKAAMQAQAEDEQKYMELLEKALYAEIRIDDRIPKPDVLLSLDDVPVIIAEELTALKAKPKMGKTSTAKIFCSAMLGCQDFKVKAEKDPIKILFIDTEESRYDVQNIAKTVIEMSGMSKRKFKQRFHIFYHREKSPDDSLDELKVLLKEFKPTVAIIDNVADLTNDFNSLEESKKFVDKLMTMASQNHCAVMTIQHENKGLDNPHAQGHLGAMLDKRAAVLLQCVKEEGLFKVQSVGTRHIQVPDFTFKYDDEGNIVDGTATYLKIKEMQAQKKVEQQAERKKEKEEKKWDIIKKVLLHHGGVLNRKSLVDKLIDLMKKSQPTIYKYLNEYIGSRLKESDGCIYLIENSQNI